jgi:hypothetical protein
LKGFIYDLKEERTPDQYVRTTKKIIEGMQALSLDDPQPLTDPDPTDPIAVEKWKISLRQQSASVPKLSCRPLQSRL